MSKAHRFHRHAVAVAETLLPIEESTHDIAAQALRAAADLLEHRQRAHRSGLDADIGSEAIALASRGADHLVAAANCFGQAHKEFAQVSTELGFGARCPIASQLREVDAA